MDTSTHQDATDLHAPELLDQAWLPAPVVAKRPAPRMRPRPWKYAVSFRTPEGRVVVVPAPVAIVGLTALFSATLLAVFDPNTIQAAALDHQGNALLRWETGERQRIDATLAALEPEIRELRRVALRAGIVPSGIVDCEGTVTDHIARHVREVAALTDELVARTRDSAELDLLPSRSPIDLSASWVVSAGPASPGVHVSSTMGARSDPFTGQRRAHYGLDLSAPAGTPVVAPSTGVVEFAGSVRASNDHARALLGKHVVLRHGGSGYRTLYAHLESIAVKAGQTVRAGDRLGGVGSTGRSTAPHLHYQVIRGEGKTRENADPLYFITDAILVRNGEDVWYKPMPATPRPSMQVSVGAAP